MLSSGFSIETKDWLYAYIHLVYAMKDRVFGFIATLRVGDNTNEGIKHHRQGLEE